MEDKKQDTEPIRPNKKKPKDDILNIVKQFVSYFEETDRGEGNDHCI